MESVDYQDTFIAVAPDCAAAAGTVPQPRAGKATVASATFEMIANNPYAFRSSDVIFTVWADRRDIPAADRRQAWAEFYAKGQPCLRGSDLGKRYGWGIHADDDGRLALYADRLGRLRGVRRRPFPARQEGGDRPPRVPQQTVKGPPTSTA